MIKQISTKKSIYTEYAKLLYAVDISFPGRNSVSDILRTQHAVDYYVRQVDIIMKQLVIINLFR